MAREIGSTGSTVAPGLYKLIVGRRVRDELHPDPRTMLFAEQADQFAALTATAGDAFAGVLAERLAAGEPVEAPYRSVAGGHHGLPRDRVPGSWTRHSRFLVHSDDRIELAD